ncbi:hypothetical protein QJQ58_10330 [Paenibacillus dendritiformis]|uniref:hypothetical protein n=1 Tax=Paenibacillus dendritiformis TaxID=130049 RepID=UPI00248A9088|nr:hypothetical protein [Paenibacillus dendritiformis]WGU96600.1 hypothetical protein QJQ58_10330 [Paenibacillus dendritiformis]
MAKLTSTIGRKRAEESRPRIAAGKKGVVMQAGARRRLRRQSRSTPGKREALGERLQRKAHPLQPSRSGGLAPDSAPQEEALNAQLTPPAEEAPSPPPADEAAHGVPAPDAEPITHPPPPEPVQAAEPQPADDMLWSQLLSRVPADYSLPDEVIAEALQHALAANLSRRGAWPRLWRRIQLRYNVTYSHIT